MQFAIGVGSNRGDRMAYLDRAVQLLKDDARIRVVTQSHVLDNPAVGGPAGQRSFMNAVWIVDTAIGAHQLLGVLRRIEDQLGRVRSVINGPRTIDLDVLMADGDLCFNNPVLQLPHPRLTERLFVLEPFAQVAPDWRHPKLGRTVKELLWDLTRCS